MSDRYSGAYPWSELHTSRQHTSIIVMTEYTCVINTREVDIHSVLHLCIGETTAIQYYAFHISLRQTFAENQLIASFDTACLTEQSAVSSVTKWENVSRAGHIGGLEPVSCLHQSEMKNNLLSVKQ